MHQNARSTFHFSRERFLELALDEEIVSVYTDDKKRERNAARQQAYRFNRYCKEHNINMSLSIHEEADKITIKRVG